MNILQQEHVVALAATLGMPVATLQNHLITIGHEAVLNAMKTTMLPDTAVTYSKVLMQNLTALDKAAAANSVTPGHFQSSWIIDRRRIEISANGPESEPI